MNAKPIVYAVLAGLAIALLRECHVNATPQTIGPKPLQEELSNDHQDQDDQGHSEEGPGETCGVTEDGKGAWCEVGPEEKGDFFEGYLHHRYQEYRR